MDRFIEEMNAPASTMPVRDQWYLEEQTTSMPAKEPYGENSFDKWYLEEMSYVLPVQRNVLAEQKTTNPKQPDVQAMDDMLKPETLPASTMPVRDQWYLETP